MKDFQELKIICVVEHVYTTLGLGQSTPIMMAIKCTHGYHVASLINLRMLISITAPPTKLSICAFRITHNRMICKCAELRSARSVAVHVARRREPNFGR